MWIACPSTAIAASPITSARLGWGWTVWHVVTIDTAAGPRLVPFAEVLVPAPYVLAVWLSWIVHYGAERELHRAIAGSREFWTRLGL